MIAIHWEVTPLKKLGAEGIYARSEDGRFLIFAKRHRHGQPGFRRYSYTFFAVDYAIPSEGRRYSEIPVRGRQTESHNASDVFDAVGAWASIHERLSR